MSVLFYKIQTLNVALMIFNVVYQITESWQQEAMEAHLHHIKKNHALISHNYIIITEVKIQNCENKKSKL